MILHLLTVFICIYVYNLHICDRTSSNNICNGSMKVRIMLLHLVILSDTIWRYDNMTRCDNIKIRCDNVMRRCDNEYFFHTESSHVVLILTTSFFSLSTVLRPQRANTLGSNRHDGRRVYGNDTVRNYLQLYNIITI